jgi:hypothetical protein
MLQIVLAYASGSPSVARIAPPLVARERDLSLN